MAENGCPTFKMILIPWLRIVGEALDGCQYVTGIRSKLSRLSCLRLVAVAKNSLEIEAFAKALLISRQNQFQRKCYERENLVRRDINRTDFFSDRVRTLQRRDRQDF